MSTYTPKYITSFGRTQGRKLKSSQSTLMESLLPKLLITLTEDESLSSACHPREGGGLNPQDSRLRGNDNFLDLLFLNLSAPLWFEIGFGGGEHLLEQAARNPHVNFIGCEPYINGMAKLLSAIDKAKLTHLRLYDGDAREVLERLPDNCIERLFVLFPDPWPKVRHHKRRLINQASLELFYRKLMPGGLLRLATDHEDYGAWMLEHLLKFNKFEWLAQRSADWKTPPSDWVKTRYQVKAEAEGRGALFLNWAKKD